MPFSPGLIQQDEFFHAGVGIVILDSACGYSAFTLMAPGMRVLTVELKVNLLAPAVGDYLQARGEVVLPVETSFSARGDAYAVSGGDSKHVATILVTIGARRAWTPERGPWPTMKSDCPPWCNTGPSPTAPAAWPRTSHG